jgi:drug/metabolite transporter (DMT)-like permease
VPARARTWSRSLNATALILIFIAAIAHASWNLFTKQASAAGAASFVWLMSAAATVIYFPVVVASVIASPPRLTALCWVFMAGTGLLQAGYFLFLQSGYRLGDLSLVYPIGRGTGAMLAALAGITLLGERPGPAGIAGILLIVAGLVILGIPVASASQAVTAKAVTAKAVTAKAVTAKAITAKAITAKAITFALITGVFIAAYTLWDKYAVSTLKIPSLVQGYASLPVMALVLTPFALRNTGRTAGVWRTYRRQVLGAAVLSPLAYILVLTALSFTAVSAVAPAREVSVLFGVLLGRRLLGEGSLARRLGAAATIAAGIICIAVG